MNWTHDTPRKKGVLDSTDRQKVIVYVIKQDRMVAIGHEHEGHPAALKGAWYGPLEPPAFEESEC